MLFDDVQNAEWLEIWWAESKHKMLRSKWKEQTVLRLWRVRSEGWCCHPLLWNVFRHKRLELQKQAVRTTFKVLTRGKKKIKRGCVAGTMSWSVERDTYVGTHDKECNSVCNWRDGRGWKAKLKLKREGKAKLKLPIAQNATHGRILTNTRAQNIAHSRPTRWKRARCIARNAHAMWCLFRHVQQCSDVVQRDASDLRMIAIPHVFRSAKQFRSDTGEKFECYRALCVFTSRIVYDEIRDVSLEKYGMENRWYVAANFADRDDITCAHCWRFDFIWSPLLRMMTTR